MFSRNFLALVLMFFLKNNLLFSQNLDSIFNSIDDNFNKSIKSQEQMFNFYIDDFEIWKNKIDLKTLSLNPEKAQKNNYSKSISNREKVILEINKYLGIPYIWGGNNPKGFDCSGLVQWTIKKTHGIQIPRTTKLQSLKWKEQLNLNLNLIKVGDLIYFKTSEENKISHVGIYIGNFEFIHAPNRRDNVKKSKITKFWKYRFAGFVDLNFILM